MWNVKGKNIQFRLSGGTKREVVSNSSMTIQDFSKNTFKQKCLSICCKRKKDGKIMQRTDKLQVLFAKNGSGIIR
jgi:hypothetical protein